MTWQDALDGRLVRRLRRPVERPGVTEPRQARAILARNLGMTPGLPLAELLGARGEALSDAAVPLAPIVYAQPRRWPDAADVPVAAEPPVRPVVQARPAAPNGTGSPPAGGMLIQRKIDPSAPAPPAPALGPTEAGQPGPQPLLFAQPDGGRVGDSGVDGPRVEPAPGLPIVPAASAGREAPGAEMPVVPLRSVGAEGPRAELPVVPLESVGSEGPSAELPVVPVVPVAPLGSVGSVGIERPTAELPPALMVVTASAAPEQQAAIFPVVVASREPGQRSVEQVTELPIVTAAARAPSVGLSVEGSPWPADLGAATSQPPPRVVDGVTLPLVREQVVRQHVPHARLPMAQPPAPQQRRAEAAATAAATATRPGPNPRPANPPRRAATPAASAVDIEGIVDTVHRRFLRRLALEGERRGVR